jgi:transposase
MVRLRARRPAGATLGIGKLAAAAVICEIGADVTAYFPNAVRVASWAGICPGHRESVGKQQRSGRRRHGTQDLEHILAEAAWGSIRHEAYLKSRDYGQLMKSGGYRSTAAKN